MKRWPLAVIGVVVLVIGLVIGRITAPSAAHADAANTWDKVKSTGQVIVGIGQDAPPFAYQQNGKQVGFDVDIARAVAQRLSVYAGRPIHLQFEAVTDQTRISWVQSGQVDMSLAHTNITRKRLANIDFSVIYGWDGKVVMYPASDGTRSLASFAGKTIGFKISSSSEGEIKKYFAAQGWKAPVLEQFDNYTAGIDALLNKQIDGFTDDSSLVLSSAVLAGHKVGTAGVLSVTNVYSPTYYGIGIRQEDSQWLDMVNYSLQDLWSAGQYQQIYNKWFGPKSIAPIPLGDHHMEPFVEG